MAQTSEVQQFRLADYSVEPGTRASFEIQVGRSPSGTRLSLPVTVLHGSRVGPVVWISSTVHGDELNGIESIRRVLEQLSPMTMAGTVIAIPVVNVFGLVNQSRYLPDRRDLNRSFPGSARGSLASRLAYLFMSTIVASCDVGIDLHTASDNRDNLPQIRADLRDPETKRLAAAFGAPIMIDSRLRDGSLRQAAAATGARVLLYEGGEALRFNEEAISVGAAGILRALSALDFGNEASPLEEPSIESERSRWLRARRGGILRLEVRLGARVRRRESLATIADPSGQGAVSIRSSVDGVVIGLSRNPLVSQGDAVIHVAVQGSLKAVGSA